MISQTLSARLLELSHELMELNRPEHIKHITYLLRRNKIISVGLNKTEKSHPKAGGDFRRIHSEFDAIRRIKDKSILRRCRLVNVRVNKHGHILLAKPCSLCEVLIRAFDIRRVVYTTGEGKWAYLTG